MYWLPVNSTVWTVVQEKRKRVKRLMSIVVDDERDTTMQLRDQFSLLARRGLYRQERADDYNATKKSILSTRKKRGL